MPKMNGNRLFPKNNLSKVWMGMITMGFLAFLACMHGANLCWAADSPAVSKSQAPPVKGKSGIRFVYAQKKPECHPFVAMPLGGKAGDKLIRLGAGYPALRVPLPDDRIVKLYEADPSGVRKSDQAFVIAPLPENSNKLLGILIPSEQGMKLLLIDEQRCRPGQSLFYNLTSETFILHAPAVPKEENDTVILEPNASWVFGSQIAAETPDEKYPLEIRKELGEINGKKRWYVKRKMMLERTRHAGSVILFLPDQRTQGLLVQKITVYQD